MELILHIMVIHLDVGRIIYICHMAQLEVYEFPFGLHVDPYLAEGALRDAGTSSRKHSVYFSVLPLSIYVVGNSYFSVLLLSIYVVGNFKVDVHWSVR
jgi:hypothetical protein